MVEVPTCRLDDVAGAAAARAVEAGWPLCAVINEVGVVAGRLVVEAVRAHDQRRVAEAMEPGPKTIRAHEDLAGIRARLSRLPVPVLFVTTPEGMVLGALR